MLAPHQNLVPGTRLALTSNDDIVPVMLIQRSVGPAAQATSSDSPSSSPSSNHALSGWTLIVPVGWGMPFFHSLVYANTRVGGQRERAQQFYEAGEPHFPSDYPCSVAFTEHEMRRESEDKGYWDRRPPAKRPNYRKLGTAWPWRCEMGRIIRHRLDPFFPDRAFERQEDERALWLVPGHVVRHYLSAVIASGNSNEAKIQDTQPRLNAAGAKLVQRLMQHRVENTVVNSDDDRLRLHEAALVRVRIEPCGRGKIDPLALLYLPSTEQLKEIQPSVKSMLVAGSRRPAKTTAEHDEEPLQVGEEAVFVLFESGLISPLYLFAALCDSRISSADWTRHDWRVLAQSRTRLCHWRNAVIRLR